MIEKTCDYKRVRERKGKQAKEGREDELRLLALGGEKTDAGARVKHYNKQLKNTCEGAQKHQ